MNRIAKLAAIATVALALWSAAAASAATLVPVGSFDSPIFLTSDPQNPDRLFVAEREGRVVISEGATVSLYGNLESLVECCESERGLLSIALAPDFPSSGRFYAAYTGTEAAGGAVGDVHLDAFTPAPAGDGELLRQRILSIGHAANANHNGGQLQFGPDGYLYLSVGDGGGGGDPLESGQDLDTLLGKVLRIDPRPGEEPPYAIPAGNPFAGVAQRAPIWSYGLRNPWRFSFDRVSGDMVIGDVGQGLREEVDLAPSPQPGVVGGAGANYGWSCREGTIAYPDPPSFCPGLGSFTGPVFDYTHEPADTPHGCAITGGYVVRDSGLGDLFGRYLYADFCVSELRSLALPDVAGQRATDDRSEGLLMDHPVSFGEDSCGRVYAISNGGGVFRLQGNSGVGCNMAPTPTDAFPTGGQSVVPTPVAKPEGSPLRLRLSAAGRRASARSVSLKVQVSPCPGQGGGPVLLKRGGRPFASKRLDSHCVARFRVPIEHRSTFRAVFAGQRSQVLTIALAKPSP